MTDIVDRPAPPETAPSPRPAPRTTEQLVAGATSAHDTGLRPRRSARGMAMSCGGWPTCRCRGCSRAASGACSGCRRSCPSTRGSPRSPRLCGDRRPAPSPELDNPTIPAGYTYLGQFVDHDLTFDTASSLDRQNDPDALTNFRSPRFDLDCIYGRGPVDDPFLYDKAAGGEKLLIGRHDDEDDLPRNTQDTALIGDPRNDENTFVSQLQLTMLKFHNKVVDLVDADPALQRGQRDPVRGRPADRPLALPVDGRSTTSCAGSSGTEMLAVGAGRERPPVPQVDRRFYKWTERPVHAGGVLGRCLPLRALHDPRPATSSTPSSDRCPPSPPTSVQTRPPAAATSAGSGSCRRSGRSSGPGSSRSTAPGSTPASSPG